MARGAALIWSAAFAALDLTSARADVAVSMNDGHTVTTPAGPASSPEPPRGRLVTPSRTRRATWSDA